MAVRNSLPNGSVSLIDVFSAATFDAAAALIPQATGWDATVVGALLAAFFPAPAATTPNPFTGPGWLITARACVQLVLQLGASVSQLFSWAAFAWPSAQASYGGLRSIASDIKNAISSHYDPQTWLAVAGPLSDTMRSSQRGALVACLLGQLGVTDPDDLFDLLLIDPEMGTCMQTTRVAQAINSVQLFVQRCLLNLETEGSAGLTVRPAQIDAATWQSWMSSYSLWAANREVFFYPENWLLPPLRDDQTPLYQAFASSLQQGTITDEAVSAALLTYLQGLDQVKRLDIRTVFWQPPDRAVPSSAGILHVFGRTFHTPRQYFYRQLISGYGWTPWQPVKADIEGDHLVAAIWEGKLRLSWPVFTQQAYAPLVTDLTSTSGGKMTPIAGKPADNYWQITLAWTEYYQGGWQPKNVTDDFLVSYFSPGGYSVPLQAPPQSAHTFKARLDGADLVIGMYAEFANWTVKPVPGTGGAPGSPGVPGTFQKNRVGPWLLGEFRFSACGDSVSVAYTNLQHGSLTDVGLTDPPDLSSQVIENSTLAMPPATNVYFNGFLQNDGAAPGLALPTANIGDNRISGSTPPLDAVTFLRASPSQFELRVSQQDWQFALQEPFFYQDNDRTFFVQPSLGWPLVTQLADRSSVDLHGLLIAGLIAETPPAGGGGPPVELKEAEASPSAAFLAGPATWTSAEQATSHNWSAPTQLLGSSYHPPTATLLSFQTHRHPFVCDLIQDLVTAQGQEQSGGISGLLNIGNQKPASSFSFQTSYKPVTEYVQEPGPETIDFSAGGAYADYNWELFFHAPLLVALTLSQNQQFADAEAWFRYIFNPTDANAAVPAPDRFWQVKPFRDGVPQTLLQLMQALDAGDPAAAAQVTEWKDHPFEPFPIARLRISAFQKYVFMAYLDNLIAWGDYLYGQVDTMESVNQATQLYIYAAQLLGELPVRFPRRSHQPSSRTPRSAPSSARSRTSSRLSRTSSPTPGRSARTRPASPAAC